VGLQGFILDQSSGPMGMRSDMTGRLADTPLRKTFEKSSGQRLSEWFSEKTDKTKYIGIWKQLTDYQRTDQRLNLNL
jgi:hypothetical protein